MGDVIEGVVTTPLDIITGDDGDVMHAFKKIEPDYKSFGEAYFSSVKYDHIKAWKKHLIMTLNIVVPVGEIKFVLFDDRKNSISKNNFLEINLSTENYQRLTVPAGIWTGFQGVSKGLNLLLNIADIPHDPEEADNLGINEIQYDWSMSK